MVLEQLDVHLEEKQQRKEPRNRYYMLHKN
jgi:hypothetical protein